MKKCIFLLTVFASTFFYAQDDAYVNGMKKALELWGEGKTLEASNLFERIAMAEKDNWMPHYYVALVNTTASFGLADEKKLSEQLGKAKEHVELASELSPNNAELYVMEALVNTAWIAYDGATYGMTLSGKNAQLYNQALQMAPENPRVVFSKAEWDMGAARFFGKDTAPYCADVEKAIGLFTTFRSDVPFYPDWGKERAEQVLAQCKSQGK